MFLYTCRHLCILTSSMLSVRQRVVPKRAVRWRHQTTTILPPASLHNESQTTATTNPGSDSAPRTACLQVQRGYNLLKVCQVNLSIFVHLRLVNCFISGGKCPEIHDTEIVSDRKSKFQGHLARVTAVVEVR